MAQPVKPVEDVEGEVKIKKKKPKKKEEAAAELKIQKPEIIPAETPEDVVDEVVLERPAAPVEQPQPEDVEGEFTIKPAKQPEPDDAEAEVKLKKKKPKKTEEAADEIKIIKKVPVEAEDEAAEVVIKKPKKKVPEAEDVESEFTIKKREQSPEETSEKIKLKAAERPAAYDEEATAETIQIAEEYEPDEEMPDDEDDEIHEFVVKKKTKPPPKQVTDEQAGAYTVKKLKTTRRRSRVDIPEYTDVENVTFRPRSTRTKEDVDQEFKIQLDSYAEEEISMSGKVRLKNKKPFAYSEAADEANIKIEEEYDDGEGPIVEEINDDFSEPQDTMYDVEEPEEFSDIEELPIDEESPADIQFQLKRKTGKPGEEEAPEDIEVEFQVKRKQEAPEDEGPVHVEFQIKPKKKKPEYQVEDVDEEIAVGYIRRRPQEQAITYEEDSMTFRKPRKKLPSSYLEGYYYFYYLSLSLKHNLICLRTTKCSNYCFA